MKLARVFSLFLALLSLSDSFRANTARHHLSNRVQTIRTYEEKEPSQAPESYEKNKDGSFSDKSDVKETLSKLMAVLGPLAPSGISDGVVSQEKLVQDVQDGFSRILLGVRESSMTPMEKRMIITEANMILSDMKRKEGVENIASNNYSKKGMRIPVTSPATTIFSGKSGPYLLVHGSGVVGQQILRKMKKMQKSIDLKVINGESLGILTEKEIEFAVRNVKTIILAADSKKVESKGGWFGNKEKDKKAELINNLNKGIVSSASNDDIDCEVTGEIMNTDWDHLLNEKSLKKLLNATMKESNKNGNTGIKVIALGKATRESKSFGSFLSGENTEFDSEVILQCKSRGLGYGIIKVGTLISDDSTASFKDRSPKVNKYSAEEEEIAQSVYENPVLFTSSRVEAAEVTRISLAVDAVLRSAAHPLMNSTTTVLTSSASTALPTDAQWDDEFLRLDGPELERIPLRFASVNQAVLRLGLIVEAMKDPKSGLITPIEVERFENGVRIIFKPLGSTYSSKNDEKKTEKKTEYLNEVRKPVVVSRTMGYLSPEKEKEEEDRIQKELSLAAAEEKKSSEPKKSTSLKLEGGLEIIVESVPYRRVRVRRCNMGAQTIVKEESETLLLRAVLKGVQALETDYRIALMTNLKL